MKLVPTEVFSRVCGFYRPVSQFNKGKKAEYKDRHVYTQQELINTIKGKKNENNK